MEDSYNTELDYLNWQCLLSEDNFLEFKSLYPNLVDIDAEQQDSENK